jgi:SAM-dependent methyltransferase
VLWRVPDRFASIAEPPGIGGRRAHAQRVERLAIGEGADERDRVVRLIESQREFYDLRAPDFGDQTAPDRRVSGNMARELARALIDDFALTGDVLELACGNGRFTRELVRHARTVTAVDGSPRMLERNHREVGDSSVTYVNADIFDWQPDRRYDAVFFGFWLSHVPPVTFDEFWALVRSSLRARGRVAFVDEDDRGTMNDDIHLVENVPVAPRTLRDGRTFDVVKVYWDPTELQDRLSSLGWQVAVRRVGATFLYGTGT